MHFISTSRTALFLIFLPFHLAPVIAQEEIVCGVDSTGYHARICDCTNAVRQIPSGELIPDPKNFSPGGKLDLRFNGFNRDALFLVPAAFYSGTRVVTVDAYDSTTHGKPPLPTGVALAMYRTMWPNVRTQAKRIMQDCHPWSPASYWKGTVVTQSILGNYTYRYHVSVGGTPEQLPTDVYGASRILSPKHLRRLNRYHIYER